MEGCFGAFKAAEEVVTIDVNAVAARASSGANGREEFKAKLALQANGKGIIVEMVAGNRTRHAVKGEASVLSQQVRQGEADGWGCRVKKLISNGLFVTAV